METELKKQIKRTIQKLWSIYCLFRQVSLWRYFRSGGKIRLYKKAHLKLHSTRSGNIRKAKTFIHDTGQQRAYHSSYSNKECLHGKTCSMLFVREHISHQGTERFHRYIDRCIHYHQHTGAY